MKRPERIDSLEKVDKFAKDVFDTFDFTNMRVGDLKTEAPTTSTLDKGRFRLVEESNVPLLYYRNLAGTVFKLTFVAA